MPVRAHLLPSPSVSQTSALPSYRMARREEQPGRSSCSGVMTWHGMGTRPGVATGLLAVVILAAARLAAALLAAATLADGAQV